MINALPFFLSRLVGFPLYQTFSSSMASVYTVTILICLFYCTITSKQVRVFRSMCEWMLTLGISQSSPSRRIFASISGSIVLIISLCLSASVQGTPLAFYTFSLFNACFLAVTTGYLCTAVFAGAATLGAPFLQTVWAGQATVAVAVSTIQLVSSVISLWPVTTVVNEGGEAEAMAARIFFGASTIFLGITLAAYVWLTRQQFYKSVVDMLERHHRVANPEKLTGLIASNNRPSTGNVFRVLKQNWIFMFSAMYVFMVTFVSVCFGVMIARRLTGGFFNQAVYPAITVRVRSADPSIRPLLFTSAHFLVFNVGDLIGRYSCSLPCLVVWSSKKILVMALLRTFFVPLLMLCNVDQPTGTTASPIIGSDILFMIILLAKGYTNGYVSTLAMLAASSLEHNPRLQNVREDADVATTLGDAFLNLGLALNSLSSFGVQALM